MDEYRNVIVIGGGITGLTVAHHLHRSGIDVALLERGNCVGGTMTTFKKDGWIIERGPNSALETTPLFKELFTELGITGEVMYANECSNKRYILRNGKLYPIPMSPPDFLKSKLWSTSGKLRLLKEPFIGRAEKEETIAEFVVRRLGPEFLDYAINPFVAGVYAGDPQKLSVRSAFPKLYALEEKYGGLIKGMIFGARERKKRREKAKDRAKQFSFVNGMQTLPDAIAHKLGSVVNCSTEIQRIEMRPDGGSSIRRMLRKGRYTVTSRSQGISKTFSCDVVVFAVPSYVASSLISDFDPELASKLQSIYYPPVAEVFFGFKKEQIGRPLDGFGYLIPEKEQRKILGTIWSSTIFSSRAPEGYEALTTFVGGSRQPELALLSDAELLAVVREELRSIMNIAGEPALSYINRWERAIPQYQLGHSDIVDRIKVFERKYKGMILGGNYRGGIAVGDCVVSAHRIYEQVKEQLKSLR